MNQKIKIIKIVPTTSTLSGYEEFLVSFINKGKIDHQFVFVHKHNKWSQNDYLKAAKEEFYKKSNFKKRPNKIIYAACGVLGVAAIAVGGWAVWRSFTQVKWKEITDEEAIEIRDKTHADLKVPETFKAYYEGGKATVQGIKFDIDTVVSYDYNQKFLGINSIRTLPPFCVLPEFYVVKDNSLYHLHCSVDTKSITYFCDVLGTGEADIKTSFDNQAVPKARTLLKGDFIKGEFGWDGLEGTLMTLELYKQLGVTVSHSFAKHSDTSLKFAYNFNVQNPQDPTKTISGESVAVMENGLMSYSKTTGVNIMDLTAALLLDSIETNATLRYQYNCKVTIPEEANPIYWQV